MERYSEYKDSGVQWLGEIPSHWEVVPLKYCININNGRDYKEYESSEGIPVIGTGGQFAYSSVEMYSGEVVFFGRKGTVDKPFYYKGGFWAVDTVFYAIPKNNMVCKYLYYVGTTIPFGLYSTSTAIPSMTQTDLMNNSITLPPRAEQNAMVEYLDKVTSQIDTAITQQQKMIELLNERKQIIINNAVTKGLDPNVKMKDSGVDWIGEIPEGWEVCKFKTLAEVKANLVHPQNYPNLYQIAPDNIYKNSGTLHDVKTVRDSGVVSDNHLFHKGQILYSKIRPNLNKVAIAPYEGLCCADMYPIETKLNTEYLQKYMLSKCFTDQVTLVIMDRVKMPKINKEELGHILVICPTTDEQKQIVHTINKEHEALDIAISNVSKQISLLQERKQIIINEVVTGKVKVS